MAGLESYRQVRSESGGGKEKGSGKDITSTSWFPV